MRMSSVYTQIRFETVSFSQFISIENIRMKILKTILLLLFVMEENQINAQSSFTNYLNNLPVLAEHSNYRNFEFKDDEETGTDIFESVLPNKIIL